MFENLAHTINRIIGSQNVTKERKIILQPLIDFAEEKVGSREEININFICTHNSRRSRLSQVWAQAAAAYFQIPNVHCYSGGTAETALFPKIVETLANQGFSVRKVADGDNPIYAIKYCQNGMPIIGFSKKYDGPFNPSSAFAAVMTCSQADGGCPLIAGAEKRISITFEDPKTSDDTPQQMQVYEERSLQIAAEMLYVFSKLNK